MMFRSIRGQSPAVRFREALFRGLAPDGSLYIPESIPRLPLFRHEKSAPLDLPAVATEILNTFIDDITPEGIREIAERAFSFPIPLITMGDEVYLLELFHGPTLAFKDVGARFMALALSHFLQDAQQDLTIAVATSGDTGSAVAHGFYNVPRVSVFVFYPSGKISRLQEQQMTTLGGNIHAIEVAGTFDDCQSLVKRLLTDREVARARNLTTANSINLGRLLPQITYYVWANLLLQKQLQQTKTADRNFTPVIVVPSGNFGNLTAALYAKHMGLSISRFLSASNANDVVPEYFTTGTYRPRPSLQTLSNAMDVGDPSNFARLQALYAHREQQMKDDILAVSIGDQETLDEIRRTYEESGIILDPHTAVGVAAVRQHNTALPPGPRIVAATAHPAKFPEVVERALGLTAAAPAQLQEAMQKPKRSTKVTAAYNEVKALFLP